MYITFSFILIYKLMLDILYVGYVSVDYAFYQFLSNFSFLLYFFSWAITIIFSLWLIILIKRFGVNISVILTFSLFLISFIPFAAMLYGGYDFEYIISNCLYWFIWFTSLTIFSKLNNRVLIFKVKSFLTGEYIILLFAVVSTVVIIYVAAVYTGFRFSMNMDSAYEYRKESDEIALPLIISYLYQWARVIIPIILCIAVIKKNFFLVGVFVAIQFLNFGYDGMRFTVLITAIAIVIPFIFRDDIVKRFNVYTLCVFSLIILMFLSILEHLFFQTGEIDRIVTFRTFFLPNVIGTWFYDFFSKYEPEYFRSSILKLLGFTSLYATYGIDYLISGLYFGDYDSRANNGLIADAMANLGVIGIICMPIVINIWLYILDRVSKHIEFSLVLLVAIYFSYCFTNNFFTIILFTNGGLIITILLYAIDRVYAKN